MNLESRKARVNVVERALELSKLAESLERESGHSDRYLRAARDRVAELEIPCDPGSLAWDAAYQQRSQILWILDRALKRCMWDWDGSPLLWVTVQLELQLASLVYPPEQPPAGEAPDSGTSELEAA